MKFLYLFLLISFYNIPTPLFVVDDGRPQTLKGYVVDAETGDSLPGVNIYFPDLKSGTVTDRDGYYAMRDLPETEVTMQVSYIGYRSISKRVNPSTTETLNFKLYRTHAEMNEVVITGQNQARERRQTPTPITKIDRKELISSPADNLVTTLARQPGVSEITTGPGISKPVIRGLGFNRVVVVKDGIKQEGQQWGDEHGLEVDPYAVESAEILKGPASLIYGSDALAGVINLQGPAPLPQGTIGGGLTMNQQTNNGLAGLSANIAGNRDGFIWDARFSMQAAHAYKNKYDGYVFNSGFQSKAGNVTLGLNKSWGYSHLHLGAYDLRPGIIEGERDSITGNFILHYLDRYRVEKIKDADNSDFKNYKAVVPYQKVNHYKVVWDNSLIAGRGVVKATIGLQQNNRKEFEDFRNPDVYGLFLQLNTLNYHLQYKLTGESWNVSAGVNGMYQQSENMGEEYLIPDYHLFDFGVYILGSKDFGRINLTGGVRYDTRNEHGDARYNALGEDIFTAFDTRFGALSGSVGATYQITDQWYLKANVARGFRAPNIAELGSNGVHEGTQQYLIGNAQLKPELSSQGDAALGVAGDHITAEMDLFINHIDNYIYTQKLSSVNAGDSISEGVPVFRYTSGDAALAGGEFSIDIHPHPLDWLHFENTFSYVNSGLKNQPDSMKYLPQTPPARWTTELRGNVKSIGKHFGDPTLAVSYRYYFAQNHVFSAYNTETPTPGYGLLDVSLSTDIIIRDEKICTFYFTASNILNTTYQNHLSRLKYLERNNATGRMGIFDMGRNFSFKVVVPFG